MDETYADVPDLVELLEAAVDDPSPLALLDVASSISVVSTPEEPGPWSHMSVDEDDDDGPLPTTNELVADFLAAKHPETDALLLVWAEMLDDDLLKRKVARQVRPRLKQLPAWLGKVDEIRPVRAVALRSVTQDEEIILLEIATPHGPFTIAVFLDLLAATLLEDAFAVPGDASKFTEGVYPDDEFDLPPVEISLADARARILQALEVTKISYPRVETETWPMVRNLLEWQLRLMPEGGEGIHHAEWTQEEVDEFVDEFLQSKYAKRLGKVDKADVMLLTNFADAYGTGDPRVWGASLSTRVLGNLIPRKVAAPPELLRSFPDLLMALVRYSHEQLGWPKEVTTEVLQSIRYARFDYDDFVDQIEDEAGEGEDELGWPPASKFFDFLR